MISSIDYGLFVVKPDYRTLEFEAEYPTLMSAESRSRHVITAEEDAPCPRLREDRFVHKK